MSRKKSLKIFFFILVYRVKCDKVRDGDGGSGIKTLKRARISDLPPPFSMASGHPNGGLLLYLQRFCTAQVVGLCDMFN